MIWPPPREHVTQMLVDWSKSDPEAAARLMPFVYEELRQLARQYLQRERPDHTLQATSLVHEAYLRLVDQSTTTWQNRAHFLGVAAQVMRRILVDYARTHRAAKRGGGWDKLAFDEAFAPSAERSLDLVALDDALKDLLAFDPRQSQIVELRFFGVSSRPNCPNCSPPNVKIRQVAREPTCMFRPEIGLHWPCIEVAVISSMPEADADGSGADSVS